MQNLCLNLVFMVFAGGAWACEREAPTLPGNVELVQTFQDVRSGETVMRYVGGDVSGTVALMTVRGCDLAELSITVLGASAGSDVIGMTLDLITESSIWSYFDNADAVALRGALQERELGGEMTVADGVEARFEASEVLIATQDVAYQIPGFDRSVSVVITIGGE